MPLLGVILPRFMAFTPLLLALLGVGVFFTSALENRKKFIKSPLIICGAIMALTGFSVLWALNPEISGDRAAKLALILLPGALLLAFTALPPHKAVRDFVWVFPWAVIAAAILLMIELYCKAPLYHAIRGTEIPEEFNLSNLNRASVCILLSLPLAVFFVCASGFSRERTAIMLGLLTMALLAILYQTASQSVQLAFIVFVLFWAAFPTRFRPAWIALAVLIALAVITAPWVSQIAFKELAENFHNAPWLQNGYAAERLEIWDYVGRYALQHPFHGFGIEATRAVEAFDTAEIYQKGVTILHPHNFALQLWIEFGLLGVLPAIALAGFLLYRLAVLPTTMSRLGVGVFTACLSIAATGYGLWQSWWIGEVILIMLFFMFTLRFYREKNS